MRAGVLISFFIWAAIFAVYVLISGCAEWGAVKSSVATHGATVADEALVTARWATCEAATVGAVRRKYSGDPEGMAAWQAFCTMKESKAVLP